VSETQNGTSNRSHRWTPRAGAHPISQRYLEDFAVGQTLGSTRVRITEDEIKAFAAEFDPQPFHLDEAAAQQTFFGI
jgi:acyl dehydratase